MVNYCFLFLITSFLSHLGICCKRDLPLEDEGFFLAIFFPISLLSRVFSLCERSVPTIYVSVEPTVLTFVSYKVCQVCSLIYPSSETSSVDTCCGSSSCFSLTYSTFVLGGRAVADPLSTQNVTYNWDVRTILGHYD